MKMFRRMKLRALLSRRHYSRGYRYQKLNGELQENDHHHRHHISLSFFRSLFKASTQKASSIITHRLGGELSHQSLQGVPRDVHRGSLAVYVGPEHKRFVMKTCYLEHPVFGILLQKSEEEFGFDYEGGLLIPCPVSVFESLLRAMKGKKMNQEIITESGELTRLIQRCSIT